MEDAYRSNAEDKTAVRIAQIHEDGETRRKRITEREETKRHMVSRSTTLPSVVWAIWTGLVTLVAILAATVSFNVQSCNQPRSVCIDALYVAAARCDHPDHVAAYIPETPNRGAMVQCTCIRSTPPDASARD